MPDEQNELKLVIDGLLEGGHRQYNIIRNKIEQYVNHFGVKPRSQRDELVADTLSTLLQNLKADKFRGNNLKGLNVYIFGIVRYKLCEEWRRRMRCLEGDESLEEITGESQSTEDRIANEQIVNRVMSSLDDNCRRLLELKFREGWSDQEIAEHLGKTKNAISTAISRCVQKARDFLKSGNLL